MEIFSDQLPTASYFSDVTLVTVNEKQIRVHKVIPSSVIPFSSYILWKNPHFYPKFGNGRNLVENGSYCWKNDHDIVEPNQTGIVQLVKIQKVEVESQVEEKFVLEAGKISK